MSARTIIFDFDGTLFDSQVGIKNALRYALRHFGIDEQDDELLTSFIGPPLSRSFGHYGFTPDQVEEAIRTLRVYYREQGYAETSMYDGVRDLLADLHASGHRLAIATAKPTLFARRILEEHAHDHLFDPICGSGMEGDLLPKDVTIGQVLDHHRPDPDQTVMIGDTIYDLQGAAACGIPSIAVTYGYGLEGDLRGCDPIHVAHTVDDLRDTLL